MSALARRFRSRRPVLDALHFAGALLGVLVVVHLWIMTDRGFDRGCFGFSEPTAQVECEFVVASDAGSLFGVSNAVWGLLFYLGLVAVGALAGLPNTGRVPWWRRLRAVMLTGGIAYSAWLVTVQATQLDAFCRLCLISAAIVTFLFLLVLVEWRTDPPESRPTMRTSVLFASLSLATVVLLAADLSYFSGLEIVDVSTDAVALAAETDPTAGAIPGPAEPAVDGLASGAVPDGATAAPERATPEASQSASPASNRPQLACEYNEAIPAVEDYASLVTFSDPFLGSAGAPVAVYEFFDPNCPHCRTLHPVMKQLAETHGELARVYAIPFMLWPDRSLLPIEALYVAAQDGKFHEMIDAQFAGAGQGYFTVPQLLQMAVDIGLDEASFMERLRRGLNREAIWMRREQIAALGIRSTPTVMINGRVVKTRSPGCLAQLVEEAAAR